MIPKMAHSAREFVSARFLRLVQCPLHLAKPLPSANHLREARGATQTRLRRLRSAYDVALTVLQTTTPDSPHLNPSWPASVVQTTMSHHLLPPPQRTTAESQLHLAFISTTSIHVRFRRRNSSIPPSTHHLIGPLKVFFLVPPGHLHSTRMSCSGFPSPPHKTSRAVQITSSLR